MSGYLCGVPSNAACSVCNLSAPSGRFLCWRNIPQFMKLKRFLMPLLKIISSFRERRTVPESERCVEEKDYASLYDYYRKLWMACDKVHFNSEVAEKIFRRFIPDLCGEVLPISHRCIKDRRRCRPVGGDVVRLCMIGGDAPYKGLPLLRQVLDELAGEGLKNWRLDVWGVDCRKSSGNVHYRGCFPPEKEQEALDATDMLVVPSIWNETFGFIVPEALSFGVPVLCSDTVGAEILVDHEMVYHGSAGLKKKLRDILGDPQKLHEVSRKICASGNILTMDVHAPEMERFYKELPDCTEKK